MIGNITEIWKWWPTEKLDKQKIKNKKVLSNRKNDNTDIDSNSNITETVESDKNINESEKST